VHAGIPPWEVLRLATSGAAERLGMAERTGSIAPGLAADIVFLNGAGSTALGLAARIARARAAAEIVRVPNVLLVER
jgi:imidazolonepropionase-like amidohydrolase